MTERELGNSRLRVSEVGLGCMGMSDYYDMRHLTLQRYRRHGGMQEVRRSTRMPKARSLRRRALA